MVRANMTFRSDAMPAEPQARRRELFMELYSYSLWSQQEGYCHTFTAADEAEMVKLLQENVEYEERLRMLSKHGDCDDQAD